MKTTVERLFVESVEAAMSAIQLPKRQVQVNKASGRNYTKVNQLLLVATIAVNKFMSNEWLSKEQAQELGYTIKKGAQATMLFNTNIKEDVNNTYVDKESGEVKPFKVKTYRYYHVFNLDQLKKKA